MLINDLSKRSAVACSGKLQPILEFFRVDYSSNSEIHVFLENLRIVGLTYLSSNLPDKDIKGIMEQVKHKAISTLMNIYVACLFYVGYVFISDKTNSFSVFMGMALGVLIVLANATVRVSKIKAIGIFIVWVVTTIYPSMYLVVSSLQRN
ncbi:hypothetical protein OKZ62_001851 [Vibrio navarrensis]|nr:hypothetical protein [Vibrio navarrensis]